MENEKETIEENQEIDYSTNSMSKMFIIENAYLFGMWENLKKIIDSANDLTEREKLYWLNKAEEYINTCSINNEILRFLESKNTNSNDILEIPMTDKTNNRWH